MAAQQSSPLNVVQSGDGTLYLEQGGNAWTMVPNAISDSDLGALTPSGELDGAILSAFLGTPGAPTLLQVVQGSDGTFYIAQGANVWTLVPNQISDANLGALTQVGELAGTISAPGLIAPAQPGAEPPAVAAPAPSPTATSAPVVQPTATPTIAQSIGFAGHKLTLEIDYPTLGAAVAGPESTTVSVDAASFAPFTCRLCGASTNISVSSNAVKFVYDGAHPNWRRQLVPTTGDGEHPWKWRSRLQPEDHSGCRAQSRRIPG